MAETDRSGSTLSPAAGEEDQQAQREEHRQGRLQEDSADSGGESDQEESRRGGHRNAEEDLLQDLHDTAPETSAWSETEEEEEEIKEEEEAPSEEDEEQEEPEVVAVHEEEAREVSKEHAVTPQPKEHNEGFHNDTPGKQKKPEGTLSCGNVLSMEAEEAATQHKPEHRLEELKRRRGNTESEELERMRQKQQEDQAELQELKMRREERRKVLEEVEKQKKQEMEERMAREAEEKRRMKEGIERRRAEAAEKRQQIDVETAKPFKCVASRGSSLKIGERAEFLNKSVQKSGAVKTAHTPLISKIDNRLEQYTTALQSHKEARPPRPALDLPVVADGIRSLKSKWEGGSTFGNININKESAHVNIGVAGLINDWLNKSPESPKSIGGKPADLKPGDVTNKRSLWENRSSSLKMPAGVESKAVTNGKPPV